MPGKFINTKVALMLLITLSPLAIADTSKSGWIYLYPEDQYQSEPGIIDNSEYTVHRRIGRVFNVVNDITIHNAHAR